ncbi:MAG: histidine kinase [Bacteroidetes bacterium]|nr:histidine kinase [Bacteroidota bacterium]
MKSVLNIILCCLAFSAMARQPFNRDWMLNDAGTPVKVNAILQDANGYLWLGTEEGVFRFNGRTYKQIPDSIHAAVTALAIDSGTVWIGYANGKLAKVVSGAVKSVSISGAKPVTAVTDIQMIAQGMLLSTVSQGLILVKDGKGIAYSSSNGLSDDYVYNIAVLSGNHVLIGTDQGINDIIFDGGKIVVQKLTTVNGLPDNIVCAVKAFRGSNRCWVGMHDGGVALYDIQKRRILDVHTDSSWHLGAVNDIYPVDENKAWIATDDGYLLEAVITGNVIHITPYEFAGKKIKKLLIGRSGVLCCATTEGLTSVTEEYMTRLAVTQHYNLADVRAMVCDAKDNLWYSQNKELYRINLKNDKQAPQLVTKLTAAIASLYADKEGRLWIGTLEKGLYYLDAKGRTIAVTGIPQLLNESVLDVAGDDRALWVSGLNGVEEMSYPAEGKQQPGLIHAHTRRSGVGSDYVYQVYPDSKGNVWMATDGGGICQYKNGKYTIWGPQNGLNSKVIYTITEDAAGNIWVATFNEGLFFFNGKKWTQVSSNDGLQDTKVFTLAANNSGQVIAVSKTGFEVWYPASKQFRSYNTRMNMGIDSTSPFLKLAARDVEGNVYIPFQQGFVVFKNVKEHYNILPQIAILSVNVFFNAVEGNNHKFNYDENQLSFRYEGISFANPDRMRYRYRLDGYSNDWVETSDELVTFPQLPPGYYTFRVQVSLSNTFASATEATYSFSIAKPFWKRIWFMVLVALAIGGIIYLYVYNREKNLRQLSALQSERMLFEYEHLKSQVNPHFLFNSLNTLASLIEEDTDTALSYTTHLSDLYRNMLAYRNKDLIQLSEEWEILQNYIFIQQCRFGDAIRVVTEVPDDVMKNAKIVPLALQLMVENAIKHNIVSKSKPLTITIAATADKITIRNNMNPKLSKEKSSGLGLVNIKKRYELLTDKKIHIGVSDTEFTVILPLL